jgi:hypothetical protein
MTSQKPQPFARNDAIPPTASALKVHGDEVGGTRIVFGICPDGLDQFEELFTFRGCELVVVILEA